MIVILSTSSVFALMDIGQDPAIDESHTSVLGVLQEIFGEGFLETLRCHLHFLLWGIRRQSKELFGEIRATV